MKKSVLVFLICGLILFGGACAESSTSLSLVNIGAKNAVVFVYVDSQNSFSDEDLAERLKEDWQNNLFNGNMIQVMVFDNKEAPQRWFDIWDKLASLSDEEWAQEQSEIFPHWIASYWRNITTGLHQVEFMSKDSKGTIIRTIKF